jgi:hypothetical protein
VRLPTTNRPEPAWDALGGHPDYHTGVIGEMARTGKRLDNS